MKKQVLLVITLLLAGLVLPLVFSAADVQKAEAICSNYVYVDASRPNDLGDGLSWATAKKHIQSGVNIVCGKGTVYVAAGIYDQPAGNLYEIVWLDDNVTLVGAGAITTIIDGGNQYRGISISSHPGQVNNISGFTIRNGRGPNYNASILSNFIGYGAGIGLTFPHSNTHLFNGSRDAPDGGGIFITDEHEVNIYDCSIINNRGQRGGGIYNSGQLTMNRCTVSGNYAYSYGGGIYMYWPGPPEATLAMTNCTVSGNTATGNSLNGGGIYCATTMRLTNVTIANNSLTGTDSAGGGFANLAGNSSYFKNCIVANNTATNTLYNNGYDSTGGAGVHSRGNNIDSENSCYFSQATDQVNTNPQLGALQNNGGPTSTCAITKVSPAYNRGDLGSAPATDQRGFPRPAGVCSIGAYEVAVTAASVSTNLGTVSFSTDIGALTSLAGIKVTDTQCSTPAGYDFPYGLFSFKISGLTAGQTARVTIKFPRRLPNNCEILQVH